jgi:phosphatidate cytidylyltransferase
MKNFLYKLNNLSLVSDKHKISLLSLILASLFCKMELFGLLSVVASILCYKFIEKEELKHRCFFGVVIFSIFWMILLCKNPIFFIIFICTISCYAYNEALNLFNKGFPSYKFNNFLAILYVIFPFSLLMIMKFNKIGVAIIIWGLLIVVASDVGAFFTGRLIGGKKLCPSISPNKTISGLVGGVICAVVISILFFIAKGINTISFGNFILLSILSSLLSIAGDIFESWLKRRAGLKDSSDLIPYHGGILDRADSIIPVIIILYFFCF